MVTIAVQAGGRSTRMGRDKALIRLADKSLIEHVLDRIAGLGEELLVTTNRPLDFAFLGVRLAPDPLPNAGALAGLHTALKAAQGETALVLACDMPFLNRPLLEYLLDLAPRADVVIPKRGGNYEPLHAVYSRGCLPAIEAALAAGQDRVISFFSSVEVLEVEEADLAAFDPEGLSFFNVNTPEDLARAERILERGQSAAIGAG